MKILILGGGGREHALAWKIAQSPLADAVFAAPGNAGIASVATCVALDPMDGDAVVAWCRAESIGLAVIGPEAPLAAGIADRLAEAGIPVFGPSAAAAELEASKAFTKQICDAAGIPTARWARCDSAAAAHAYLDANPGPIVVKADGLAAGKGVVVADTTAEARAAVDAMFSGSLGQAGTTVVIEERLAGEEVSFFALSDGHTVLPLAGAQDHKRAFDGDTGPNTGGMGAYSPAPVLDDAMTAQVMTRIVEPTIVEMARRGTPYCGLLYAGLMIGPEGPKLIEYNVRFGDPETQVLMLRLASDLVPALLAVAEGRLAGITLDWRADPALTVVMAASGYPGSYARGTPIGLPEPAAGVTIFHAGTGRDDGQLVATGGRVLNVSAMAPDLAEARALAYRTIDRIDWPGGFCRRDIAARALGRRS